MSDFAQTVKQQADIVKIVEGYIRLRKAGAQNYSGLCPFHKEKSPSFSVHAVRQFYHCFGCQASGDVFSFVGKIENVGFPEAVRIVAQKCGIPLPKREFSSPEEAASFRLLQSSSNSTKPQPPSSKTSSAALKAPSPANTSPAAASPRKASRPSGIGWAPTASTPSATASAPCDRTGDRREGQYRCSSAPRSPRRSRLCAPALECSPASPWCASARNPASVIYVRGKIKACAKRASPRSSTCSRRARRKRSCSRWSSG